MTEVEVQKAASQYNNIAKYVESVRALKGFSEENCLVDGKFDVLRFWYECMRQLSLDGLRELEEELNIRLASYDSPLKNVFFEVIKDRIALLERGEEVGANWNGTV